MVISLYRLCVSMPYSGFSGETLHTVLMRLFQNCVQQNSTVAVKCLELFASTLSTNNAAVLKFVLQAMSSLFGVAKASVRGRIVNITLRRLAAMREADDDDKALVEEVNKTFRHFLGIPRKQKDNGARFDK